MKVKEGLKCGVKYQADIIRIGYRAYSFSKEENQLVHRGMLSKISRAIKALTVHRL